MRAIILTSTFLRHQYLINYLTERVHIVGVWQEEKSFQPLSYAENHDDELIIKQHFQARDDSERSYFGAHSNLAISDEVVMRRVGPGKLNDLAEVELMISLNPSVVFVFGTGILRSSIIAPFDGNILNIHLGLSPYYRGSGTNFWPLVNGEPEFVGATIHYLDAGIDTGPILAHARPIIEMDDGPHDLGNKTIVAAVETIYRAAIAHTSHGPLEGVPQTQRGSLYQRKDFSADAVKKLYQNFEDGMIENYLNEKEERDSKLNLIALANIE